MTTNPRYPDDRDPEVKRILADARRHLADLDVAGTTDFASAVADMDEESNTAMTK